MKNNCKECQCMYCTNKECPIPCSAHYSCDQVVTKCTERRQ